MEAAWESERVIALFMAVLHHGLSSLAEGAIPARAETVVVTAEKFEAHLLGYTRDGNKKRNNQTTEKGLSPT